MPKLYARFFFGRPVLDDIRTKEEWHALFKEQGPFTWGYPTDCKGNFADWMAVGEIKEVRSAAR